MNPSPALSRPFDRRQFLRFAGIGGAAIGGAAVLAACSTGSPTSVASTAAAAAGSFGTIGLALSWIKNVEFAGEYFATDKGYFTSAGFDEVTLLAGGGQTSPVETVVSGQALVGLVADGSQVGASVSQGAPIKIIGAHLVKSASCLLSLEEKTPIKTLAEVKGKKIGLQASVIPEFQALLELNGMTIDDIEVVTVQYDIAPLISGACDAFCSFATNEPLIAEEDGYTPVIMYFADYGLPLVGDAIIATEDTINSKRDLLKAFLKAESQGWADAINNPTQSATYAVTKFGADQDLNQDQQVAEIKAQSLLMVDADVLKNGLLTISDDLIAGNVKAMVALGYTVTADMFDLSLLKEVYSENPDLIVSLPVSTAS
ncbi:ABC transporter substrate-binding protein [Subtercola endophyticus]|uniref:ABC transporter substrate-binding protein n=1 Tax=Subtercola endophyticus TaxID=2895559 RepID=UPI001E38756E|nr:ABC transporter substrate-binding protein [Subtercola endophyticus]UFS60813.1 ABC transporter substrate-binding protein [Subtercola endophyticus]